MERGSETVLCEVSSSSLSDLTLSHLHLLAIFQRFVRRDW